MKDGLHLIGMGISAFKMAIEFDELTRSPYFRGYVDGLKAKEETEQKLAEQLAEVILRNVSILSGSHKVFMPFKGVR